MTEIERRFVPLADLPELRADDAEGKRQLAGYGAIFNHWSVDLGGFREKIRAGAFVEALKRSDVVITFNHDPDNIMARTASGTAKVWEDQRGMGYEADLVDRQLSRDVLALVKRRDVTGSSFAFTVEEDEWSEKGGRLEREIIRVREVFDTGPVTNPAYSTRVSARSYEAALDYACTHGFCPDEVKRHLDATSPQAMIARVVQGDPDLVRALVDAEVQKRDLARLMEGVAENG